MAKPPAGFAAEKITAPRRLPAWRVRYRREREERSHEVTRPVPLPLFDAVGRVRRLDVPGEELQAAWMSSAFGVASQLLQSVIGALLWLAVKLERLVKGFMGVELLEAERAV